METGLNDATGQIALPSSAAAHAEPNQFALLGQRRFAPFFWTQFLGAGNDNLFKFAFTVLVTYELEVSWLPPSLAGLAIGALVHPALPALLGDQRPARRQARQDGADPLRQVVRDRASWRWPASAS